MKHLIYKITNLLTNKVYIGQTKRTLKERWQEHCKPSNTFCFLLKRAIIKYGRENFKIEEIDSANTFEQSNEREIFWISHYQSADPEFGYNYLKGGAGWNGSMSDESKQKISLSVSGSKNGNFGKPKSAEFKKHLSKIMTGKKHLEETKNKLSKYFTGKNNPNFGKPKSKEWKEKSSISQKNRTGNTGAAKQKRIMELTTGLVFNSITDAAKNFKTTHTNIWKQMTGIKSDIDGKKFAFV